MTNDNFSALEERIDRFRLSELHTAEEWQSFFDDAISLLDHPDDQIKDHAIDRLQKALWSENSQPYRQPGFTPVPAEARLLPILDAIAKQDQREFCLLRFTKWGSLTGDQKEVLSGWLKLAETNGAISADAVSTAKIQTQLFGTADWNETKSFLEPFFDHPNDLLRAAAAAAFGEMYSNKAINLPALRGVMEQVKSWEIERPGFAGAFLGQLSLNGNGEIRGSGINLTDWILEIIAKRKTVEPDVPFYNGIDFHAHEILSCNPEAVRKLMDFGAESVAAMAATEENRPIAGMQALLEELANSADDSVSRVCAWHLAYHYRTRHPQAERRGYVRIAGREDVEVFLVFDPLSPAEQRDRPYAATIYPRDSVLSDEIAWKWINRLVPPAIRPRMEDNDWPYQTPQIRPGDAIYVYGPYIAHFYGDSDKKLWDRVWVKWPLRSYNW